MYIYNNDTHMDALSFIASFGYCFTINGKPSDNNKTLDFIFLNISEQTDAFLSKQEWITPSTEAHLS